MCPYPEDVSTVIIFFGMHGTPIGPTCVLGLVYSKKRYPDPNIIEGPHCDQELTTSLDIHHFHICLCLLVSCEVLFTRFHSLVIYTFRDGGHVPNLICSLPPTLSRSVSRSRQL